ncbi:NERD domain-containing protein [Ponticoccus gilvus]|nr:NERD domain-containing protein [Enemella evansiae]
MVCQIRYLSSAGIHPREKKGVAALAQAFPSDWLVFASLTAFPKNSSPIEIDLLVVMDDRIVLLELKDWNGPLKQKGDLWIHVKKRERSPVVLGNEKAKKIKSLFGSQISQFRTYVDSRVVLTASSTRDLLSEHEKPFVLTLDEAVRLGDREERNRLLGKVKISSVKPNMLVKDFDRILGNSSYFQPSKMLWDGYGITDLDFFVHRGDIWREHRAQLEHEKRIKALLRLWRFDKLPVGLNEPGGRRLIADRELKVLAFLDENASWMAESGILKPVGPPPDEVLTEHHQVLSTPSGWTTLRRYLARNGSDVSNEQRVDIVHSLARMISELHRFDVAHRDIGGDAIWMGSPTNMSLTGFCSATIPDDKSVADYLEVLGTYAETEPDWGGMVPTAKERDVRSLGLIMAEIGALDEAESELPEGWAAIVEKAIARPGERYSDVIELTEALGELLSPSGPLIDQSRLDEFETTDIPYVKYPATGDVSQGDGASRYEAMSDGERLVVKVWNGLMRGNAERDHTLLSMLEQASTLAKISPVGIAKVVSYGLSQVGPFVITKFEHGSTLAEHVPNGEAELFSLLLSLVESVDRLHQYSFAHGDLHPGNVIISHTGNVTLIDFLDISLVGAGRKFSPSWVPEDYERCTQQQVDRFAVCKMVLEAARKLETLAVKQLAEAALEELNRRPIETLETISDAIKDAQRTASQKPDLSFLLTLPDVQPTVLSDGGENLWVKGYMNQGNVVVLWVTGLKSRLLIRIVDDEIKNVELTDAPFHQLGRGEQLGIKVEIKRGPEMLGVREFASHLVGLVQLEEQAQAAPVIELPEWEDGEFDGEPETADETSAYAPSESDFDIRRMWIRAAAIEEETVLQVRLDRRLADDGNNSVYEYQASRPLEFDDADVVEVRQGGMQGRRAGFLDVPKSDEKQLTIKEQRSSLAEGSFISLIDKRDRVSKERRRRAVERIVSGKSVIPNLVDYFEPKLDPKDIQFETEVEEGDLAAYGLNDGQKDSFKALLKVGPVGLLQGPPGSGKTRFIASLTHWLLTKGGAQRILIASQSHEAVNNVLQSVLGTYQTLGGRADILRVGSRGATERVLPYQARALRERYKIRFENGLRTRVASAAAAAGISRSLAHDIVKVDQVLGRIHQTMMLVQLAAAGHTKRDDQRRSQNRLSNLEQEFAKRAEEFVGREVAIGVENAEVNIEAAYSSVLAKHPKSSLSDLAKVRQLLRLAGDWKETLGTGHRNFDEFLAKTRQVVAGTCVGLGQSQIRLEQATFDWVIVDEAARCTSGELAVPLQLGSRVLLVGDQRQLRPMIERQVQKGLLEEFGEEGRELARSDFERAFGSPYGQRNAKVLDEQYRMTPTISDLVSDIFYKPHGVELKPSADRRANPAFQDLPSVLSTPVVWLDTTAMAQANEKVRNDGRDIWNDAEIRTVISLLHRLAAEECLVQELAKSGEPQIGVICMYSEQKRRMLREWSQQPLSDVFKQLVTIDTVDAYQGKENEIVILSLVRSNNEFITGHVGHENRCNVAISRAKERLFIVGNSSMWSNPKSKSPVGSVLTAVLGMKSTEGAVLNAEEIRS